MLAIKKYTSFIDEKITTISKENFILDLGGGARFQKWLKKYESLFEPSHYHTMDIDSSTQPDIIGDIHKIPLEDNSIDAIICSSVLEHVDDPIRVMQEIYRILKKGGKLFIYVPSTYPYHARTGHYPDMWRFFDDSLNFLCKDFSSIEICKFGGYFKALSFFMPMQHRLQKFLTPLASFFDSLFHTEHRNTTAGYYVYAVK